MSKSDTYVARTEKFLEALSKELAFEVVDVEFVKEASQHYLRVYCDMDKEGGITIDDCAELSAIGLMKPTLLMSHTYLR